MTSNSTDEVVQQCGYSFNNGGLNNQKLALIGLFVKGFHDKRPIMLPAMVIKDHISKIDTAVPLAKVFDLDSLLYFASKYKIDVLDGDSSQLPPGGWPYFALGTQWCNQISINQLPGVEARQFMFDLIDSLVPLARHSYLLHKLKYDIFKKKKVSAVAQFRIEADWDFFSKVTLKSTAPEDEDYAPSFDQIALKMAKSLPDAKDVLVICDEAATAIPKSKMADECRSRFGINLYWKSDFLTRFEMEKLNNLDLSIIDFELALCGQNFIGLTRSSFSNQVTFTKFMRRQVQIDTDYIYNTSTLRLDRRTDNGSQHSPFAAVRISPSHSNNVADEV